MREEYQLTNRNTRNCKKILQATVCQQIEQSGWNGYIPWETQSSRTQEESENLNRPITTNERKVVIKKLQWSFWRRRSGNRYSQKEDHVKMQGGDATCTPRRKAPEETEPAGPLTSRIHNLLNCEKINVCYKTQRWSVLFNSFSIIKIAEFFCSDMWYHLFWLYQTPLPLMQRFVRIYKSSLIFLYSIQSRTLT